MKALHLILTLLFLTSEIFCQWPMLPSPNVAVTSDPNLDATNYWACSDNAGGSYTVWEDDRYDPGGRSDVFCQRINKNGTVQFALDGIDISVEWRNQKRPKITDDGNTNAIMVWEDERNWAGTSDDIYVQKIDSSGNIIWALNGIAICNANNRQEKPWIVKDNKGGAIIAWEDRRNNGATGRDIYAQRIDSSGTPLWAANGIIISNASNDQRDIHMIADGNGGAIIAWEDRRLGRDIYAQKVDSSGNIQWTNNGELICDAFNAQRRVKVCTDGSGGGIFTWEDKRTGTEDIYMQRINSTGLTIWTNNGEIVCDAIGKQKSPTIVENGSSNAVITWEDERNAGATSADIYSQKVNTGGIVQWTVDGIIVCNSIQRQRRIHSTPANNGATLVTWEDRRNGSDDIYVELISSTGILLGGIINGVHVCNNPERQRRPFIFKSGSDEWIVVWEDDRNDPGGNSDIYAQGLNSNLIVALPDEFVSFTVEKLNKKVKLKWVIDSEVNIEKYIIERSSDGINFTEILSHKSKGNSNNNATYVDFDNDPLDSVAYYKLNSVNFNGDIYFSQVAVLGYTIDKEELPLFNVYPNPLNNQNLTIDFATLTDQDATIVLLDIKGKTIHQQKVEAIKTVLNFPLSKGIYFVTVLTQSNRFIQKLIVL